MVSVVTTTPLSDDSDGQCLPPTPKVAVDRNNIYKVHSALVQSFQESSVENNPYRLFKESNFYAIMHDGMQKFGMEVNDIILRYATPDLVNIQDFLQVFQGSGIGKMEIEPVPQNQLLLFVYL